MPNSSSDPKPGSSSGQSFSWLQRYLDGRREDDRLIPIQGIERKCRTCSTPFLVAPHRPDSRFCTKAACKAARHRQRQAEAAACREFERTEGIDDDACKI